MARSLLLCIPSFLWLSGTANAGTATNAQWGVDRTVSPWNVCFYDSTNTCQNVFTLQPTGGGVGLSVTVGAEITVAPPSYAVDPTAAADSTAGIQAAINAAETLAATTGLAGVKVPCGDYLISATLQISANNTSFYPSSKGCVQIVRRGDFGPSFQASNTSGVIAGVTLGGFTFTDLAAIGGTSGYETCANSPYQVVFDGVNAAKIDNVTVLYGCGGIALRAVNTINVVDPKIEVFQIPGASGQNGLGTGIYSGFSTNTNLTTKYSTNIWLLEPEIEGGAVVAGCVGNAFKLQDGIRVDGTDGVWMTSPHVQGTTQSDYHFAHRGPYPEGNIYAVNAMADITLGYGILMDGTVNVSRAKYEGFVSAAGCGGVGMSGIGVSGTGGFADLTLDVSIDGFNADAMYIGATNSSNLTIRPKQYYNNNLADGANPAIDLAGTIAGVNISGGIINAGTYGASPNIHVGANISNFTLSGVTDINASSYALTLDSGANYINVTGNDFTGSGAAPILDNSGASAIKSFAGNLGLPWIAYTPSVACGSGTVGAFGAASGRYNEDGRTVYVWLNAPITTNGSCGTDISATLPVNSRNVAVIPGVENAGSGKMLKGVVGASSGSLLIENYDNTYPGATGASIYMQGSYEATQ